jgi:CRISPR-associated endoribonuclease Cas6
VVDFAVSEAFLSGASHPDSGHCAPGELQARWDQPPESVARTVTLDFLTPTCFSMGREQIEIDGQPAQSIRLVRTLPDPRTLFSSLRHRWKDMGGAEPGDAFDEWVERHLDAEPLQLSTRTVQVEGSPLRGFVGQVRFRLHGNPRWMPLVHLLTDLSFWTGIGYQTTRGMGQVRRLNE